jgi:hypothetical protein
MRILRSVASIVIGLGFLAATTRVVALVGGANVYLSLFAGVVGAVLAGWLTARLAPSSPYAHAATLAVIVAVISVPSSTGAPAASQPSWYPAAIGLTAVLGILLGGKLRAAAAAPHHPSQK